MDDKKKNKKKSPAWAVVVLLLMLLRALNDGNMAVLPVIIIGLSIVAVIGIVMASTKKGKCPQRRKAAASARFSACRAGRKAPAPSAGARSLSAAAGSKYAG